MLYDRSKNKNNHSAIGAAQLQHTGAVTPIPPNTPTDRVEWRTGTTQNLHASNSYKTSILTVVVLVQQQIMYQALLLLVNVGKRTTYKQYSSNQARSGSPIRTHTEFVEGFTTEGVCLCTHSTSSPISTPRKVVHYEYEYYVLRTASLCIPFTTRLAYQKHKGRREKDRNSFSRHNKRTQKSTPNTLTVNR